MAEAVPATLNKIGVEKQITGRVAQEGQLGGDGQIGLCGAGQGREDPHAISLKVSHGWVELQESYFHISDKKKAGTAIKLFAARLSFGPSKISSVSGLKVYKKISGKGGRMP
jgi:hypothetical protein